MPRKHQAKFSNGFKYAGLKISVICIDVMQIYREPNINLISATLLFLKASKLNFNGIIFEKYCNMGYRIGNEEGISKLGCEAIRLMKW